MKGCPTVIPQRTWLECAAAAFATAVSPNVAAWSPDPIGYSRRTPLCPSSGKGSPCAVLLARRPRGRAEIRFEDRYGGKVHPRNCNAELAHPPVPPAEGGRQWPDRHVDGALSAPAWLRDVCDVGALRHPVARPPSPLAEGGRPVENEM